MTVTARVYQRRDKQWEWQLIAENGQIVATSGSQGYTRREDAVRGYNDTVRLLAQARLVVAEKTVEEQP